MTAIRLAIVGFGKIAKDQHIAAIAGTDGIELTAIVSRNASINGIAHFATLDELPNAAPDWRQTGPQTWDVSVETDAGRLTLSSGGSRLVHDGRTLIDEQPAEYHGIYRHFVGLIADGESNVDLSPLVHVADAFMLGRRRQAELFIED